MWNRIQRFLRGVWFWFVINVIALAALIAVQLSGILTGVWGWSDAYSVGSNLLLGGLVSFAFYYLVVHIPEMRKRGIIKENLLQMYLAIKRDILEQVLSGSYKAGRLDLPRDSDSISKLMTTEGFKAAFQGGRKANEGYYAFMNHMQEDSSEFREIVLLLRLLSKQIEYVLHNYSFDDQKLFDFFKWLDLSLLRLQESQPGYDEPKQLLRFIYEVFSGFNWIDGDRGYDFLEKTIREI